MKVLSDGNYETTTAESDPEMCQIKTETFI